MQFDAERAKDTAIDTGAAVVGAVAGLAVSNKVTEMITKSNPASTLGRHVPAMILAAVIGAQALDLVPKNPLIDSALQGIAVTTGMAAVREYSGANDPTKAMATTGLAHLVNQYVPAFTADGQATMSAGDALAVAAASAAAGVHGLGFIDYTEPGNAMWLAGQEQQAMPALRQLGNVPLMEAAGPKTLG